MLHACTPTLLPPFTPVLAFGNIGRICAALFAILIKTSGVSFPLSHFAVLFHVACLPVLHSCTAFGTRVRSRGDSAAVL